MMQSRIYTRNALYAMAALLLFLLPMTVGNFESTASERYAEVSRQTGGQAFNGIVRQFAAPGANKAGAKRVVEEKSAPQLEAFFPEKFDQPFIVESNGVKVALRTLGARQSPVTIDGEDVLYREVFTATDSRHKVESGRSEEFLFLKNEAAPRAFDYELTGIAGADNVTARDGAIFFSREGRDVLQIEAPWVIDATGRRSDRAVRWEMQPREADGSVRLRLLLDPAGLTYPLTVDPSWKALAYWKTAANYKWEASGTALTAPTSSIFAVDNEAAIVSTPNLGIMMLGGYGVVSGSGAYIRYTQVFDPGVESWSPSADLPISPSWQGGGTQQGRSAIGKSSVRLSNDLFVFGGYNGASMNQVIALSGSTGLWSAYAAIPYRAHRVTATRLNDGNVLITGGGFHNGLSGGSSVISNLGDTAIYKPGTNDWVANSDGTGANSIFKMPNNVKIWGHTATLLNDGRVLIVGGGQVFLYDPVKALASQNPWTTVASPTGSHVRQANHSATLLGNGKVLIVGGDQNISGDGNSFSNPTAQTLIFDPATNTLTQGPSLPGISGGLREPAAARIVDSAMVIIAGGYVGASQTLTNKSWLFDSATNQITAGPDMPAAKAGWAFMVNDVIYMVGGSSAATYKLVEGCPTITVTAPTGVGTMVGGTAFSGSFSQTGGATGAITYALKTGSGPLPAGLTLASNGQLSGTPTASGSFPVTVTATDANGCVGELQTTLVVACPTINVSPPVAAGTLTVGTPFIGGFTQGGGAAPIAYALKTGSGPLPTGLTLASNGQLSGTPTASGSFPVTVTATDANGCVGELQTTLVVACPTITVTAPTGVGTMVGGTAFSGSFTQSGGATPITSYAVTSGTLPTGVSLAPNGTLSGTPTVAGSFPITVRVTDKNGCTGTVQTTLVIASPTITVTAPTGLGTMVAGTTFSGSFTQSGGATPITSYAVTSGTLPAGVSLAPNGTLSGTPTVAGSFPITVTVTDKNGFTGAVQTTLVIASPTITVTAPTGLGTMVVGTAFSGSFTQSGGATPITSYAVTSGSLPAGVSLAPNGTLSGTPTVAGSFPITVRVTDKNGFTGTVQTTLVITCPTITLTPSSLIGVKAQIPYSQQLAASGGNAPYTFAVTAGTLPPGLQLSPGGLLSGTATVVQSYNFTVTATSAVGGCTGQQAYTLLVGALNVDIPNVSSGGGFGPGETPTIVATVTNNSTTTQSATYSATLPSSPSSTMAGTASADLLASSALAGLPGGLIPVPGSCRSNIPGSTCDFTGSTLNWSGTLAGGQRATITFRVQIGNEPVGALLCIPSTAIVGGFSTGTVDNCVRVSFIPPGPGSLIPATAELSDNKAGSVLIFNLYTSSSTSPNQNTQFNITNTSLTDIGYIHLFFVDGSSCAVADRYLTLMPNQTTSFLASDLDPGTTGYVVAVATDPSGCPANFNFLIGDVYVTFDTGHAANLAAVAVSALIGGLPACNPNSATATLNFDGTSYNVLPRAVAVDSINSRAAGNNTLLILNRLGGNLLSGADKLGPLFGLLYDDQEQSASFTVPGGTCQILTPLSNSFPRTTPRFENVVSAGRTGWMKLWHQNDLGISGAVINYQPNGNARHQGHNLHALTTTSTVTMTIPVFPVY